jgi:hypothetical protein
MGENEFLPDQVREDLWEGRLVRLVRDDEEEQDNWVVQDMLTEQTYQTPTANLHRRPVGEMEVLAFIAKHCEVCACCGRDGGRTFEPDSKEGRFCGGCFRASCDTHGLPCRLRKKREEGTPTPVSSQTTVPQ